MACVLPLNLQADTIDYWHVYYNDVKIHEFNQHFQGTVKLKLNTIKSTDSLSVSYFNDTPCHSCTKYLVFEALGIEPIKSNKVKGKLVKIAIRKLSQLNEEQKEYNVYYVERQPREELRHFVFLLKFE